MRPNILFVLSDQHRGDWLGSTTPGVRTPELDRLAREGTRFSSAICPSPLCAPSRASLATSLDYDRHGVRSNADDTPADAPNFYRGLSRAGYHVMTCGKLDLFKEARSWGADGLHRRDDGSSLLREVGFTGGLDQAGKHDAVMALREGRPEPYGHFLRQHGLDRLQIADFADRRTPSYVNCRVSPLPDFAYCDNWVGANALRLIREGVAQTAPWFLQVNFLGPHEPMDVSATMADRWAEAELPLPADADDLGIDQHREIRRRYAAMIENVDRWLGTFRAVLESAGSLENTVIVYASDHGEMLGDRGLWAKLYPFQPSLGVPLIVAGPGAQAGQRRRDPVSLIDLGPTFAELAGTRLAGDVDGRSIVGQLAGAAPADEDCRIAGFGAWRVITDGRFKLIAGYGRETIGKARHAPAFNSACLDDPRSLRLYDLAADSGETANLAATETALVARLVAALKSRLPSDNNDNVEAKLS
jgi:arylsulfatase A-like enzyme